MIGFFIAFVLVNTVVQLTMDFLGSDKMWSQRRKQNYYRTHKHLWK